MSPPPDRSEAVKVNLGSGGEAVSDWVNVDNSPSVILARSRPLRALLFRAGVLSEQQYAGFSRDIVYGDVTKRLRFSTHSVDFIFSSHMIEHLSRDQGLRCLTEACRILKPGGVIRIATPDLAALVEDYRNEADSEMYDQAGDSLMLHLGMFRQLDGGVINRFVSRTFSGYWHQWVYDEGSLTALLQEAGFTDVRRQEFQLGEFPDLERIESRPGSLILQASSPLTASRGAHQHDVRASGS